MVASAADFFYTSHRERVAMRGAKIVITALAIAGGVVWGILMACYAALWYGHGRGSLYLFFAVATAPYHLPLSVGSPIVLAAIAVAGLFLVLGLLVVTWGMLLIEST
jgi:hypothetical protein